MLMDSAVFIRSQSIRISTNCMGLGRCGSVASVSVVNANPSMAAPFKVESCGDFHSALTAGGRPHSSPRAFGRFARAVSLPGVGVSFADVLFHALNCSGLH